MNILKNYPPREFIKQSVSKTLNDLEMHSTRYVKTKYSVITSPNVKVCECISKDKVLEHIRIKENTSKKPFKRIL